MDQAYLFVFTRIASTEGFIVASIIVFLYFLAHRKKRQAGLFFLSAAGLLVSTSMLKELFRVARPDNGLVATTSYAFPSGHAAGSAFLAVCLCYFGRKLPKPLRYSAYAASILFALAVGASRLAFNVHTPLQVGAGFALGALWAGIFVYVLHRKAR